MKNAILIDTKDHGKIAIEVTNFSKVNVIEAIRKLIKTDVEIEQLSASMSSGIYGLKNLIRDNEIVELKQFRNMMPFVFQVEHIYIF